MSKAGYPYDNATIKRYFNTLKTDLVYQHRCHTEKELFAAIEEFASSPFETCSVLLHHIKIISQSEDRQKNSIICLSIEQSERNDKNYESYKKYQ